MSAPVPKDLNHKDGLNGGLREVEIQSSSFVPHTIPSETEALFQRFDKSRQKKLTRKMDRHLIPIVCDHVTALRTSLLPNLHLLGKN